MVSPEATIEDVPTADVEPVGRPHAGRWTGLWIGVLSAIVGIAALAPSRDAPPDRDCAQQQERGAASQPPGGGEILRTSIALLEPHPGDVETSGIVKAVGRYEGDAERLVVTVRVGSLVLGRREVDVGPEGSFEVAVPIAAPLDGIALPATLTVGEGARPGRALATRPIDVASPPMTAWLDTRSSGVGQIAGTAPAGARIEVAQGACGEAPARTWGIVDPSARSMHDARSALAAFGRQSWRAELPVCGDVASVIVRWSGSGGERGALYANLTPLDAAPRSGHPGSGPVARSRS